MIPTAPHRRLQEEVAMQRIKHIIEQICHAHASSETGSAPSEPHPNFWMY